MMCLNRYERIEVGASLVMKREVPGCDQRTSTPALIGHYLPVHLTIIQASSVPLPLWRPAALPINTYAI